MDKGGTSSMALSNVLSVQLGSSETAILDKQNHKLQIYDKSGNIPILKLYRIVDLVVLRDLLNDAYPVDMYVLEKDMQVRKK